MKRIELNEGNYAFVLAQVALLNCEVAGMVAENQQRTNLGFSTAFCGDDFFSLQRHYESIIGYNAILEMEKST